MTDTSVRLERLVQRIHELVEQPGSVVTWNDRIADPDNPTQSRQIDVSIRRDDLLTIIECRFRSRPQDVVWIEELIGRRASLKADAMIAVSYGGFTEGAQAKAQAYGIVLRDFRSLTIEEIQRWGQATRIVLTLIEYISIELDFGIPEVHWSSVTKELKADPKTVSAALWPAVNEAACKVSAMNIPSDTVGTCEVVLRFLELAYHGIPILEAHAVIKLRRIQKNVDLASVVAYDSPDQKLSQDSVVIERDEDTSIEILQSSNLVSVDVDLSSSELPINTQLHSCAIDLGRVVQAKFVRPIGLRPPRFDNELIRTRAHKMIEAEIVVDQRRPD